MYPMEVAKVHVYLCFPWMLTGTVLFLIVFSTSAISFPLPPKGFASLEAKRRFRVPRITPKHPDPTNESLTRVEQITEEAATETDCSPASLFDNFRYLGNVTPPKGYVEFKHKVFFKF